MLGWIKMWLEMAVEEADGSGCKRRPNRAKRGRKATLEDTSDCEGILRGHQVHQTLRDCQLALDLMRSVTGQHVPEPAQLGSHGRIRKLWRMCGGGVFAVVSLAIAVPFAAVMSPILVPLRFFERGVQIVRATLEAAKAPRPTTTELQFSPDAEASLGADLNRPPPGVEVRHQESDRWLREPLGTANPVPT